MKLYIIYYKISLYVCIRNETRLGTFVIQKKFKINNGLILKLDHIGCGFYEFQHVYSMHATPIEIIGFFGKFKFRFHYLQLLHQEQADIWHQKFF